MSIATKTGDSGTTALMYGHRVSKCHPRVEACGAVDELNAAIGFARAAVTHRFVTDHLFTTQKELVALMGELATLPEDISRYAKDGFPVLANEMTSRLDRIVKEIEAQNVSFKDWATPGATQGRRATPGGPAPRSPGQVLTVMNGGPLTQQPDVSGHAD